MTRGFVLEFQSQEDIDYYHLEDPVHLAFAKAGKGLAEDSVVVSQCCVSYSCTICASRCSLMVSQCFKTTVSYCCSQGLGGTADIEDGVLFGTPTPKKPSTTYTGSCHCGAIEWTAKLNASEHILCHCDTCKKLGGGPYSLNQIISKVRLATSSGGVGSVCRAY